ncbi:MAG TPA: hybrid sensor histidine kinase/response regulator [Gammaproteobacteria bacterium]|nr:hybrid sensor histidine kinase/response regulator [Gammaproteobacteria bacterium]
MQLRSICPGTNPEPLARQTDKLALRLRCGHTTFVRYPNRRKAASDTGDSAEHKNPVSSTGMPDMNSNSGTDTTEQEVLSEQLRIVFSQLTNLSLGNLLGTVILILLYHGRIQPPLLWGWTSANLLLVVVFTPLLVWRYRLSSPVATPRRWIRAVSWLSFLRACVWGALPLVFYLPGRIEYQLVNFIFVLVGVSMALLLSAPCRPIFFAIVPPILAPVTILFLFEGGSIRLALAAGSLFYGFMLYRMFHRLHAILLQNIGLKHEKSALAEQLVIQKNAAEEANAAKSRFLATASHDLRQPLHAQTLFVEELAHRIQGADERLILEKLQKSMTDMRQLFNELLDISRLDAQAVETRPAVFSLFDLLADVLPEYTAEAQSKNLQIRLTGSHACVRSDRQLLTRVIRNLLSNAVRYTDNGRILVGCRRRDGRLRLEIHDTGPGIPEQEQERIFHEFYRLERPDSRARHGLGLGLSIVRRLGELLECRVQVHSVPGHGSCFSLDIPCAPCEENPAASRSSEPDRGDVGGRCILVIDDDRDILDGMTVLLTRWTCNVATARSEAEALEKLAGGLVPHAIIADYRLAQAHTGTGVVMALRTRLGRELPGIIVTGDAGQDAQRAAHAAGLELLHKPVNPAQLRTLLSYVLSDNYEPPAKYATTPP